VGVSVVLTSVEIKLVFGVFVTVGLLLVVAGSVDVVGGSLEPEVVLPSSSSEVPLAGSSEVVLYTSVVNPSVVGVSVLSGILFVRSVVAGMLVLPSGHSVVAAKLRSEGVLVVVAVVTETVVELSSLRTRFRLSPLFPDTSASNIPGIVITLPPSVS
jgi:hypothetical protein